MYTWPSLALGFGFFPFLNQALHKQLLLELSIKEQLLSILSHQKGPLKFTDFALFSFLHRMVRHQLQTIKQEVCWMT